MTFVRQYFGLARTNYITYMMVFFAFHFTTFKATFYLIDGITKTVINKIGHTIYYCHETDWNHVLINLV